MPTSKQWKALQNRVRVLEGKKKTGTSKKHTGKKHTGKTKTGTNKVNALARKIRRGTNMKWQTAQKKASKQYQACK